MQVSISIETQLVCSGELPNDLEGSLFEPPNNNLNRFLYIASILQVLREYDPIMIANKYFHVNRHIGK
jgi:hypothetical protein